VKQFQSWGTTNIRRCSTECCRHGASALGICAHLDWDVLWAAELVRLPRRRETLLGPASYSWTVCSLFSTGCTRKPESVAGSVPRLHNREIAIRFPAGVWDLSLLHSAQSGNGSHQASLSGCQESLSLRVKRPRLEAEHSPLSSAEIQKQWNYLPTRHLSSWRALRLLHLLLGAIASQSGGCDLVEMRRRL